MVAALGYRQRAMWSIVGSAVGASALTVPRWLLNSLLRTLCDGYRVYSFDGRRVTTPGAVVLGRKPIERRSTRSPSTGRWDRHGTWCRVRLRSRPHKPLAAALRWKG